MNGFSTSTFESIRLQLRERIKNVSPSAFDALAIDLFRFQAKFNEVYASYLQLLNIDPAKIDRPQDIPFLPIGLFKKHQVITGKFVPEVVFTSSGTTGSERSRHSIRDLKWYLDNTVKGFTSFYGSPSGFCWLCLLPSYLEREGSSLVAMAQHFIKHSSYAESGFFLRDLKELKERLDTCQKKEIPTVVLGVSFALLDFAEQYPIKTDQNVIWMETGGMKGQRREMTRAELHKQLSEAFGNVPVHSEYGMTELCSQAYSKSRGVFDCSPTMKVMTRELTDPRSLSQTHKRGQVMIMDLANLDSCSFIETEDIGRKVSKDQFEILGRLDHSALRGCNLMVADL